MHPLALLILGHDSAQNPIATIMTNSDIPYAVNIDITVTILPGLTAHDPTDRYQPPKIQKDLINPTRRPTTKLPEGQFDQRFHKPLPHLVTGDIVIASYSVGWPTYIATEASPNTEPTLPLGVHIGGTITVIHPTIPDQGQDKTPWNRFRSFKILKDQLYTPPEDLYRDADSVAAKHEPNQALILAWSNPDPTRPIDAAIIDHAGAYLHHLDFSDYEETGLSFPDAPGLYAVFDPYIDAEYGMDGTPEPITPEDAVKHFRSTTPEEVLDNTKDQYPFFTKEPILEAIKTHQTIYRLNEILHLPNNQTVKIKTICSVSPISKTLVTIRDQHAKTIDIIDTENENEQTHIINIINAIIHAYLQ